MMEHASCLVPVEDIAKAPIKRVKVKPTSFSILLYLLTYLLL